MRLREHDNCIPFSSHPNSHHLVGRNSLFRKKKILLFVGERMDEGNEIFINDEVMDINKNNMEMSGLAIVVVAKLGELISNGKLTSLELDEKLLEGLKVIPVDEALLVLNKFQKSSSENLLDIINCYQSAANGPNEEKLKSILEKTGYSLEVTTKHRIYGGPPPRWGSRSRPGPDYEVFVYNIPKTVFEDKLIPVFKEYGRIWSLRLSIDPSNGQSRQYAFITYCDRKDARSAVKKLNGYEIDYGKLEVFLSCSSLWLISCTFLEHDNKDKIFDLADFLVSHPLKLELKKFLGNIKRYQTVADFCKILFRARNEIQELKRNSGNLPNNKGCEILEQIQEITGGSSSDQLVETFLESFNFRGKKKRKRVRKSFADLLNAFAEKPKWSTSYLKHMINTTELLLDSYFLKLPEEYRKRKPLERLFLDVNSHRNSSAENIFFSVFKIHIAELKFNEEEKKQIGALMVEAIKPIQRYTDDYFFFQCEEGLSSGMLLERSALQIIKDIYGEFPAGNTTLLVKLKKEIEETIKILDEFIKKWGGTCTSDEKDRIYGRSLKPHVPESHEEWWSKYNPKSFDIWYEQFYD